MSQNKLTTTKKKKKNSKIVEINSIIMNLADSTSSSAAATSINLIRNSILGDFSCVPTPLGARKITYADSTASGRSSKLIENSLAELVLPLSANTHTSTSYAGYSSHAFLDESRGILRDAVGASATEDAVIFCGRGATAASNLLVHLLLSNALYKHQHHYRASRRRRRRHVTTTPDTTITNKDQPCCTFPGCGRIMTNDNEFVNEGEEEGDDNDEKSIAKLKNLVIHCRTHADGEESAHSALAKLAVVTRRQQEIKREKEGETVNNEKDYDERTMNVDKVDGDDTVDDNDKIHVIVGPFAHNSSYLPWKEAGALVTHIPSPSRASLSSIGIDMRALIDVLNTAKMTSSRPTICVFTTASNVTGALCGTTKQRCALTALCHAYGSLVIWDCAATASHSPPEMNSSSSQAIMTWEEIISTLGMINVDGNDSVSIARPPPPPPPPPSSSSSSPLHNFSTRNDAIFFSMHKFVGGGGGGLPGVLVVKRKLLKNTTPNLPGGGTVFFVSDNGDAIYTGIDEEREEGGTPDVAGCARASLCMMLCKSVGWRVIQEREAAIANAARREWSLEPNIIVVGLNSILGHYGQDTQQEAVPIISLFFKHQPSVANSSPETAGFALHWGFVSAVLNDFFGIQCRGGCLCAGVFAQSLLGISHSESAELERALLSSTKNELLRPGFVRISFSFYMSQAEVRYIIDAVKWVARYGHKILHLYTPQSGSGEWRVRRSFVAGTLKRGRSAYLNGLMKEEAERIGLMKNKLNDRVDPRIVINACTKGDINSGIFEAGQRGDTRIHPRTWLSSVSFFKNNSGQKSKSESSILTQSEVKIVCTEEKMADLYQAYLSEADLVVLGCMSSSSSPGFANDMIANEALQDDEGSVNISSVIEPEARHLRWFAVSSDNVEKRRPDETFDNLTRTSSQLDENAVQDKNQKINQVHKRCPWPLAARVEAISSTHFDSPTLSLSSSSALSPTSSSTNSFNIQKNENDISNRFKNILSTPFSLLTPNEQELWNGGHVSEDEDENEIAGVVGNVPLTIPMEYPQVAESINTTTNQQNSRFKFPNDHILRNLEETLSTDMSRVLTSTTLPILNPSSDTHQLEDTSRKPISEISSDFKESHSSATSLRRTGQLDGSASLAYRRSDEFAKTQQALKSVVGVNNVPPAISRSLAHGLREAITEFGMIRDGDRILVGLSGGKDSMTLLLQLLRLQATAPVSFAIGAATVDPQSEGYNPRPLISWCESLGVPYFFESQPIIDLAGKHMGKDSICSFCSRLKRGVLYSACRREGYNVLALGQHLDDFAESFVMSAFRNGIMRTMKACYNVDKGDLRVIRPLVFVRENITRAYASSIRLPIIPENCPACFTGPTERYKVKRLLATEAVGNPNLFNCLMRAMRPLMTSAASKAVREGGVRTKGRGGGKNDVEKEGEDEEDI
jgi:tRNA 2-thiocytidine biosynthesis protein TtcA